MFRLMGWLGSMVEFDVDLPHENRVHIKTRVVIRIINLFIKITFMIIYYNIVKEERQTTYEIKIVDIMPALIAIFLFTIRYWNS